ncbi:MAG: hypothetical protein H7A23_14390 [Leptospiraceae bacterium]|nr:hypothetical protein [Leptospiraceae bacterium]MCP5495740.1 hypothetical protein [Leptospiraceae bacterium]
MKKLKIKKLKTKLMLAFSVIPIFFLLVTILIIYKNDSESIRKKEFNKLIAIRDLKVYELKNWMEERMNDIKILSLDREIKKIGNPYISLETSQRINEILQRYVENYHLSYNEIFILNSSTGVVMFSTQKESVGNDESQNLYYTETLRTKKIYIKDVHYSKKLGKPSLTISIPVFSKKNGSQIIGVLVTCIDLEHSLYELLFNRTGMGETGETLIVNKDVIALSELRWHKNAPLKLKIKAKPAVNSAKGNTGILETPDYRGELVLAAYTYVPIPGWGFVAKQDLKEVYEPIAKMIQNFVIIFIFTSIIIYFIAHFLAEEISRPIISDTNEKLIIQTNELKAQTKKLQEQSQKFQNQNILLEAQRKKIEEVNQLKSQFLSNISHELRTPLNSVLTLSQVLLLQLRDRITNEESNYLKIIERNGNQLLSLINNILDLSKIESGKMDMVLEEISLKSLINRIVEAIEPIALQKGIGIKVNIDQNIPTVHTDAQRLSQVFQNVMSNAIKFTNEGKVEIESHYDSDWVSIAVIDTGIGIPENSLSDIFEEFRQVDGSISRQYGGTGLGLSIAKKMIELLGGNIKVKSELGKGTEFTITFPISFHANEK